MVCDLLVGHNSSHGNDVGHALRISSQTTTFNNDQVSRNDLQPPTYPPSCITQFSSWESWEKTERSHYTFIQCSIFQTINNDPSLFTQWNDTQAVTNTERLYMVMTHVSFTDIGQATIGNILNTISEKSLLTPMMYQRVRTVSVL